MIKKIRKLKIGIVGCGAIGSSLAKAVVAGLGDSALLAALYDINPEKSKLLSKRLAKTAKFYVDDLKTLIRKSDLVIEASCGKAAWDIARKALSAKRSVMIMSVGGMSGHLKQLFDLAKRNQVKAYFPSGAISGIDALKAANTDGVKKVVLTTRKHPDAFSGVEYVVNNFNLKGLKKEKILFCGTAEAAVKYFPQNVNVAAVLGLAGIGMHKTKVRIIADPQVRKNIHEILIESKAAKIFTRTENVLHPQNPKTSYLAVLSAVATLKQILQPVKIGT
jgi:aspartate dehydrogenase